MDCDDIRNDFHHLRLYVGCDFTYATNVCLGFKQWDSCIHALWGIKIVSFPKQTLALNVQYFECWPPFQKAVVKGHTSHYQEAS
jgi:hypothetical protein